jgi:tetratricopeptide (TPR) repeat protein
LSAAEAEVFGLLALAPGPDISSSAAVSLTGLGRSGTRTVLRRLEQASLIGQDAAGRYRMHDLIRRYAASAHDVPDSTRQAALRRLLDFYTHTAHTAARLLDTHRGEIELAPPVPDCHPQALPDIPAAMEWFDTEHQNLLAAQRAAAAHGLHRTAWQLAWTLNDFHYRRGHRHDQLAVWELAVDSTRHLPDTAPQNIALRLLGRAHLVLGQHQEAVDVLNQALALSERENDRLMQAKAHYTLASILGFTQQALEHAQRSLDLYRDLDRPNPQADALNCVGWIATHLGDHDTGREHCQAALAIFQQHDDAAGQAQTIDSLGYIDHHSGRHHDAVEHYRRAIDLYRDLDNTYEIPDTLDRLGHPLAALGDLDQARAVWQEALDLYRQQGRDDDAERVERQLDGLDGH